MAHRTVVVGCAALLCVAGSALAQSANGGHAEGPDWVEGSDAGSKVETAQQTTGSGQLRTISGTLGGESLVPDFEDMYLIRVTTPTLFSITGGTADFDPVLWLFNVTKAGQGFGLLANNDGPVPPLPRLLGMATDGTGAAVTTPGVYAVAVSGAGRFPVSINGGIFTFASTTEISGPDGPGGLNPHSDWAGPGVAGSYLVVAEGVGFYAVPAPGAGGLLAIAGFVAARRRRRA